MYCVHFELAEFILLGRRLKKITERRPDHKARVRQKRGKTFGKR